MTDTSKHGNPLPEPLFLLHCGEIYGNERGDWDCEANSGKAVDALADEHAGDTLGLFDEHEVRSLVAQERTRCSTLTDDMLRYAMAALGTGSPAESERFRAFWLHAITARDTKR